MLRRPVGHPGAAASARAWPSFVPRVELDVELKAIDGKLLELNQRLSRQETRDAEAKARIEALEGRCEKELVPRFELETQRRRLDREAIELREEFREGLDELRAYSAPQAEVIEARAAHTQRLDMLESGLAAAGQEASSLREAIHRAAVFCEATYTTQANHSEACEGFRRNDASLARGLRQAESMLDEHASSLKSTFSNHSALRQKHEDLVLATSVTSSCLDCLKEEVAALSQRCIEELVAQPDLAITNAALEDARKVVEAFTANLQDLKTQVDHDHNMFRRTIFNHSDSFKDMHNSLEEVYKVSKTKGDLRALIDVDSHRLAALEIREKEHWDASQHALEAVRSEHGSLDSKHKDLAAELRHHVTRLDFDATTTRQYSTHYSLEQMSKAVLLTKSMDKLERNHKELQTSLAVQVSPQQQQAVEVAQ